MSVKCDTCQFRTRVSDLHGKETAWACDYIGHHLKRRPCPAGDACTVYVPLTERNKPKKIFLGKTS